MVKGLVSIIIVNWNGKDHLTKCLRSLKGIDYKKTETIIVDNGSTDGSIEYIKHEYPGIICIRNADNSGFSKANNQGIKKAKGEYILLLNNDTKVRRNFLSILVKKISLYPLIGAVQPKILHWEKPGKLDSIGSFLTNTGFLFHLGFEELDSKKLNKEIKLFSGKGSCLLFKRKILEITGNFNEDFFAYFEETDLCWRVWLAGYHLIYVPQAVIYHKTWGTTKKLPQDFITFHSFRNRISSLAINLETGNVLLFLPLHLSICVFIAFCYLVSGKVKNGFAIVWAILSFFKNLGKVLRKRKYVQKRIRKVPDSILFREIIRNPKFSFYLHILNYSFVRGKVFKE